MKTKFFVVNPKSYLYSDRLYKLASKAEELCEKTGVKIYVTAPFTELSTLNNIVKNAILTAQHADPTPVGRGMGHVVLEMLKSVGVKAVVLNHAEHKVNFEDLQKTIVRAKELDMETIVCADSYEEVRKIASLSPTIILCEPTSLIGTGKTSSDEYMEVTTDIIREVDKNILVMQAAGVTTSEDVYNILIKGYDGTGCTSGIVLADDMLKTLENMIDSVVKASKERD